MSSSQHQSVDAVSESECALLRQSVRNFLARAWPVAKAVENSNDAEAVAKLWLGFAGQGLASLGSDAAEAGLREIILVFEELGRASCPAPLLGAITANLALAAQSSDSGRALLEDLHQGRAIVAAGFGGYDGDLAAGHVTPRSDTLHGSLSFIEGARAATHFLVFTDEPSGVALVARDASGLTMRVAPGLAVPPFFDLMFEDTPALLLAMPSEMLADIALVARLTCAGRALGAAERAFSLAVDHARTRKQFGHFIGQFQAVQHKLADCLISLDGARPAIESAAEAHDRADPVWRVFASSAIAFASAMRKVFASELQERLGQAALDILGASGLLSEDAEGAPVGEMEYVLRHAVMGMIGGGTNEIQRNVIAQRGLELPR